MFVTDLISAQDAKTEKLTEATASGDQLLTVAPADSGDAPTDSQPPSSGNQELAWAPNEPAPKKKRLGLWIGLGVGALAIGAGAASMILIAPGTTVAGIPVGWLTPEPPPRRSRLTSPRPRSHSPEPATTSC